VRTPTFEQGDVVRVPFPYTDKPVRQYRPALVISRAGTGEDRRLVWVLMITSAENKLWPGDVDLGDDFREAGLPVPSLVRTAKVATIDPGSAERLGRLDAAHLQRVLEEVADVLGGTAERVSPGQ